MKADVMATIYPEDISGLQKQALIMGLFLQPMPYKFYQQFSRNQILYFMHCYGFYSLPTYEMLGWLKSKLIYPAIEICAGNGGLGRALNIPRTDSYMQAEPAIKMFYDAIGQPTIDYPKDVEKLNYLEAIEKYKPNTVIGSYATHIYRDEERGGNAKGIDGKLLLSKVKRFIHIGNKCTHQHDPLLDLPHEEHYFPWLITRSKFEDENCIFIWHTE